MEEQETKFGTLGMLAMLVLGVLVGSGVVLLLKGTVGACPEVVDYGVAKIGWDRGVEYVDVTVGGEVVENMLILEGKVISVDGDMYLEYKNNE